VIEGSCLCGDTFHIHVDSKASWFDFNDTHPRFAEGKR